MRGLGGRDGAIVTVFAKINVVTALYKNGMYIIYVLVYH